MAGRFPLFVGDDTFQAAPQSPELYDGINLLELLNSAPGGQRLCYDNDNDHARTNSSSSDHLRHHHHHRHQTTTTSVGYQPWSAYGDHQQNTWLNDLGAIPSYATRGNTGVANHDDNSHQFCPRASPFYATQFSNTHPPTARPYRPFGSISEPGSDYCAFQKGTQTLSQETQSRAFFSSVPVAETRPTPTGQWTERIPTYNPFGSSLITTAESVDFSAPHTRAKRSYSDVIKIPPVHIDSVESKSRGFDTKSLPADRPSSSTPPPCNPRRRPLTTRSSDDMFRAKTDNQSAADTDNNVSDKVENGNRNERSGLEKNAASKPRPKSSCETNTAAATAAQHVFFDPKRIFQPKPKANAQKSTVPNNKVGDSAASTRQPTTAELLTDKVILNNGKCTSGIVGNSNANKTPTYINNDLRNRSETRKQNNTGGGGGGGAAPGNYAQAPREKRTDYVAGESPPAGHHRPRAETKPNRDGSPERSRGGAHAQQNAQRHSSDERSPRNAQKDADPATTTTATKANRTVKSDQRKTDESQRSRKRKTPENGVRVHLELWLLWAYAKFWPYVLPALKFVPIIVFKVLVLIASILWYYLVEARARVVPWIWARLGRWFPKTKSKPSPSSGAAADRQERFGCGLDYNIVLPSTGEEAINRLLGCQGKDPYSILGLHGQCTDDDIKRYYRKQAILVHPDKNSQPGAEEAFKILNCAFEQIGSAEKRLIFDEHMHESAAAEEAAKQFGDLLTKLEAKLREASNRMRCDKCNGTHLRTPVDRATYAARYCAKCQDMHMAKEGDCWAEATMFGFYWHYYACMDGHIYDITEWAKCQDNFSRMRPNSHHVFYVLASGTNARQRHQRQHQRPGTGGGPGNINERDWEDLLKFMAGGGAVPKDFTDERAGASAANTTPYQPPQNGRSKKSKSKKKRR